MTNLSVPLEGMHRAETLLNNTAAALARSVPGTLNAGIPAPDTIDLSDAMLAMIEARNSNAANVNVAHAMDQMQQATLNVLG